MDPPPAACTTCVSFGVTGCGEGFVSDGDHGCAPVLPECGAGQIATPGACRAVGVATCGEGFVREEDGCRAIVANDCDGATMAKLGDKGCVAIGACAATRYPAIAGAIHVDGAYTGESDGSEARPYVQLADALAVVSATRKTIALAEGAYELAVAIDKPVEMVGVCPEKVVIEPPKGVSAITINADVTLRSLAVTREGLSISRGVTTLTSAWIHDTNAAGVSVAKGAKLVMTQSVVSRTNTVGVALDGASASIRGSEIRRTVGSALRARPSLGTRSDLTVESSIFSDNSGEALFTRGSVVTVDSTLIRRSGVRTAAEASGIYADSLAGIPPTLTVRKTVIERVAGTALGAYDGKATIEDTTIRDTSLSASGPGIAMLLGVDPKTKRPIRATVARSLVSKTEGVGVVIGGGVVDVSGSIIRDGRESGTAETGRALVVIKSRDGSIVPEFKAADLLVERHAGGGIVVSAGTATFDRMVVRDISPEVKKRFGYGFVIYVDAPSTPSALIRRSLIERTHDAGIISFGAQLDVEDTVVREIAQRDLGVFGHGIHISRDRSGRTARGSIRRSVISNVFEVGIEVFQSSCVIEDSTIAGIRANAHSGIFGDGISVTAATADHPWQAADVSIKSTKVAGAARTAVSAFNARAVVASVLLRCNALDLSVESVVEGHPTTLEDGGGNTCGCDAVATCHASQSNLAPVDAKF